MLGFYLGSELVVLMAVYLLLAAGVTVAQYDRRLVLVAVLLSALVPDAAYVWLWTRIHDWGRGVDPHVAQIWHVLVISILLQLLLWGTCTYRLVVARKLRPRVWLVVLWGVLFLVTCWAKLAVFGHVQVRT